MYVYARENDFSSAGDIDKLAMKRKAQDASNNKRGALTTTKLQVLRTYIPYTLPLYSYSFSTISHEHTAPVPRTLCHALQYNPYLCATQSSQATFSLQHTHTHTLSL